ncbi:RluA family pseudouridine synthase [Shewanella surugensis]|uniref:Dual-specificity RNA pseudouridine synthase RluA n=1 Tax=Shewanella surugensis TaxID=212020 RepID=A0ABT0LHL0_9GAMM|nr:RluA family pseudouridine synthase [Shewanella surugensis]MCL1127193.1 RluA family pseudouridine synthase [Shewanella surugensis]
MQIFTYQPPNLPWLDLRYIDRDIIVINKPSGLLSNPGIADHTYDCALTRLQTLFSGTILVHRLDCATSGIMVFARNKKAESHLKTQFQDRQTKKIYIAIIQGILKDNKGEIHAAITPDRNNPPKQKIAAQGEGKVATTYYKELVKGTNSTLIELTPITGRTHQLRIHMLSIGHPILGDDFYGTEASEQAAKRLQLHAQSLTFTHPYTTKEMTFKSSHSFSIE